MAAIEAQALGIRLSNRIAVRLVWKFVSPGSVGCSLDALGMAVKLNKYTGKARFELKPWIVEAARARLGHRRLF